MWSKIKVPVNHLIPALKCFFLWPLNFMNSVQIKGRDVFTSSYHFRPAMILISWICVSREEKRWIWLKVTHQNRFHVFTYVLSGPFSQGTLKAPRMKSTGQLSNHDFMHSYTLITCYRDVMKDDYLIVKTHIWTFWKERSKLRRQKSGRVTRINMEMEGTITTGTEIDLAEKYYSKNESVTEMINSSSLGVFISPRWWHNVHNMRWMECKKYGKMGEW